jgi:carboxyl-terminal processing protease
MNLDRRDREIILRRVSKLVEKRHFNPGFNGQNWKSLLENRTYRILDSKTPEAFEQEVSDLLSQLGTSHTGFYHVSARKVPARFAICATFKKAETQRGARWMFQDVHNGGPAALVSVEPGDLLLAIDDQEIQPPMAVMFPMGQHSRITVCKRDGSEAKVNALIGNPKNKKRPMALPRSVAHSRLEGSIGLIKVTMFPGAVGIDFAKEIDEVICDLQDCTRLIIDLRGNTGGGIGGLRLMSYLTPGTVPIGYSLTRRRSKKGYTKEKLVRFRGIPASKLSLPFLLLRYAFVDKSIALMTEGLGPRKFQGRTVILVNEHSASAAEMLAAFAIENRLATLVGVRTAGRLLSGTSFKVGKGYILGLPAAAYFTWQGQLLEGKGISPDVLVELSCEDLRQGRDTQMEKAIEVVKGL